MKQYFFSLLLLYTGSTILQACEVPTDGVTADQAPVPVPEAVSVQEPVAPVAPNFVSSKPIFTPTPAVEPIILASSGVILDTPVGVMPSEYFSSTAAIATLVDIAATVALPEGISVTPECSTPRSVFPTPLAKAFATNNLPNIPALPDWLKEEWKEKKVVRLLREDKFDNSKLKHVRLLSKTCESLMAEKSNKSIEDLAALLALCASKKVQFSDTRLSELLFTFGYHLRAEREAAFRCEVAKLSVQCRFDRASCIASIQNKLQRCVDSFDKKLKSFENEGNAARDKYKPLVAACTDIMRHAHTTNLVFNPSYITDDLFYDASDIVEHALEENDLQDLKQFKDLGQQINGLHRKASFLGLQS
jgi:hypothetical protein